MVAGSCPTMTYHIALTTRTTITTIYRNNNNNNGLLLLQRLHAVVQGKHVRQHAAPQPLLRVHRVLCSPCCQHRCLQFAPCSMLHAPARRCHICRSLTGTISGRSVGLCTHVIGEPFMHWPLGDWAVDCCCTNMAANLPARHAQAQLSSRIKRQAQHKKGLREV